MFAVIVQEAEDGQGHSAGALVCVEEEEGVPPVRLNEVDIPWSSWLTWMHVASIAADDQDGVVLLMTEFEASEVLYHSVDS